MAEIRCECCQGKGIRARVPVIMMGDGPFRELTVQDELRRQSYQTYAEKRGLPWWQCKEPLDVVFPALTMAILAWGVGTFLFFGGTANSSLIFFGGAILLVLFVMTINRQITSLLRGNAYEAWEKDRDAAQAMYVKILKEYGEITDPHKAVIWISGETKAEAIKRDSILVMIGK